MSWAVLEPSDFPWFDYSRYSFSLGLATGAWTFLSGHTASRYDARAGGIVVRGGMAEQTRTAYAKADAILAANGQGLSDVVRVVEYVSPRGVECYEEAASVRTELFGEWRPAVCTTPVRALLRPDALIEVEVVAAPRAGGPEARPEAARVPGAGGACREAGGIVYLPSLEAVDEGGTIIGASDLVAQIEAIYDRAEAMLSGLGLGLDRVVHTVDYVSPGGIPEYKRTAAVRRARLGPVYPASTGIFVPRLMHPEALIRVGLIASRASPVRIDPGWPYFEKLTFSPGVKAGDMLYLSGQGAIDPNNGEVVGKGDVAAQADFIYRNIVSVVQCAGGGAGDLVKTIEYTTPAAGPGYRQVASVRSRLLSEPLPVSTGPICDALVRPEMLIEIDACAVLGAV